MSIKFTVPGSGDHSPQYIDHIQVEELFCLDLEAVHRPEVFCHVVELFADDVFHGAFAKAKIPQVPNGKPPLLLPLFAYV